MSGLRMVANGLQTPSDQHHRDLDKGEDHNQFPTTGLYSERLRACIHTICTVPLKKGKFFVISKDLLLVHPLLPDDFGLSA